MRIYAKGTVASKKKKVIRQSAFQPVMKTQKKNRINNCVHLICAIYED